MKKIKNNKKGFTLIEMIVVIVIIAILVALAVPAVMGYVEDARKSKAETAGHSGMVTMQTAIAKEEASAKLTDEKLKDIIKKGKDASGMTGDPILCNAEIKTDNDDFTCKDNKFKVGDSLDDIKSYIFTVNGYTMAFPSNGGDVVFGK